MRTETLPYRIIRDFLAPADRAALLAWAYDNKARFVPAQLSNGRVDPEVRNSLSLRDLGPLKKVLKGRVRETVPLLIRDLRGAAFAISGVELELVAHNNGAFFTRHIDTYTVDRGQQGDRVLSGVYYFYREPRAFTGGELRVHKIGGLLGEGCFPDILPEQNSFVAFHSWWPHEVLPIACPSRAFADSRFAVNCWVYCAKPNSTEPAAHPE